MKRSVGMLCSDRVEPLLSAALAGRSDDQIFIPSLRVKSGKREKKKTLEFRWTSVAYVVFKDRLPKPVVVNNDVVTGAKSAVCLTAYSVDKKRRSILFSHLCLLSDDYYFFVSLDISVCAGQFGRSSTQHQISKCDKKIVDQFKMDPKCLR